MMDIAAILIRKYPDTKWELNGSAYAGLTWLDESPKPTEAELLALWPEVEKEINKPKPQPMEASIAALTPETDANTVFEWMAAIGAENVGVASARGDINMNLLSLGNLWQSAPAMASAGLDTAFNKLWDAASEIPDGYQQIVEDWRDEYTLRSLA